MYNKILLTDKEINTEAQTYKLAVWLGAIIFPFFILLDWFMYPDFIHSICPKCLKTLYPDFDINVDSK